MKLLVVTGALGPFGSGETAWRATADGTVYWVEDLADGSGDGNGARWTGHARWTGQQINPGDLAAPGGAGALLMVGHQPVAEFDEQYNDWMDRLHVPYVRGIPGVLAGRRFAADGEAEPRYRSLYHLESVDVMSNPHWTTAPQNPVKEHVDRVLFALCTPADAR